MSSLRFWRTEPVVLSLLMLSLPVTSQSQDHTSERVEQESTLLPTQQKKRESLLLVKDPKVLEERIKTLNSLKTLNSEDREELLEIYFNGKKFGFGPAFRAEGALSDLEPDFAFEAARKVLFQEPPASAEKRVDAIRLMRRRNVEKSLSKLTPAEVEKLFAQLDKASSSSDYGLRYQQALLFQDLFAFHRERIESEVTKRLSSQDYRQNPAVEQLFEVAQKLPNRMSASVLNLHLATAGAEPKARVLSTKSALNYLSRYPSGTSLDSSVQMSIRDLKRETDYGIRLNWVSAISNLSSTGQGEFLDLLIDGSKNPKSDLYRDHLRGLGSVARNPAQFTNQFAALGADSKKGFNGVVVAELRNTKPVLSDEQALTLFATSRIYTHPEGVDAGRKAAIDEMTQMGLPVSKCEVASGPRATCGQVSSRERTAAYLDIFLFGGLPLFSLSEASRGSQIPDLSSQNRGSMARALEGSPR